MSSSIFGGRQVSPAPGLLPCPGTTSGSPGLFSKLSESQVASRPLAPASSSLSRHWGEAGGNVSQPLGLAQPAGQPAYRRQQVPRLAQPLAKPSGITSHQPNPSSSSNAGTCIDWSSYMSDDTVAGAPDIPETNPSAYTGPFSMLDDSQHKAKHAQHMHSAHKPARSPLEANLQPLIPSPVYGQASRPLAQQQHQLQQPAGYPKQPAQQQARQMLQQARPQQQQIQQRGLHNDTASKDSVTGSGAKLSADSGPAEDRMSNATALGRSAQGKVPVRAGTANVGYTDPTFDKENALLGRKSLFGEQVQLLAGSQASAPAWDAEPASNTPVDDMVAGVHALVHRSSAASAGGQQDKPGTTEGHDTVDFSSVFDFL